MYIQTLPAAPGDVIVVTVPQTLSQPQRDALEARVAALVAGTRVLILDGGVQMAVLKRPAPDAGVLTVTGAGRVEENDIVRHVVGEAKPVAVPAKIPSVDGAGGGKFPSVDGAGGGKFPSVDGAGGGKFPARGA